jgi:hypothetical protein
MANGVDPATPPAAAGTQTAAAEVAAKVTTTRVEQADPPIDQMSSTGVILLTLYYLLFGLVAVNVLVNVWPPPAPADSATRGAAPAAAPSPGVDTGGSTTAPPAAAPPAQATAPAPPSASCRLLRTCSDSVALLGGMVRVDFAGRDELRLILIALFAGGLGALVSSALSFASYLGSRRLDRWWTVWYLVRPPVGMALALITYFLLRAGLLSPGANLEQVSPYGVAAIGGLMGMFIKEATDKLKDVARALFKSEENEQRAQPLAGTKQTETTTAGGQVTAPATAETSITIGTGAGTGAAPATGTGTKTADSIAAEHQTDPGA